MQAKTSPEDFAALIRHAGMTLDAEQTALAYEGWAFVEQMLDRVRGPGLRPRGVEPAHVFVPLTRDGAGGL